MVFSRGVRHGLAIAAVFFFAAPVVARADLGAAVRALHAGNDVAAACTEIMAAGEKGNAAAMAQLGDIYRNGTCDAKDAALAKMWYHRAAENGDAYAQMTLGSHYRIGDGGYPKDVVQAYKWYDLAATAPKPRSKATGGEVFPQLMALRGTLDFNDTAADLQAAVQRDALARKMTSAQIAEAKKLAARWRAKRK